MQFRRALGSLLVACALTPTPAAAALITFEGHVTGEMENILFNGPGLVGSGLMVTGSSESGTVVSFSEDSTPLLTPASGQARVAGQDGAAFNWLTDHAVNPFYGFEANVNLAGASTIRITALGSSMAVLEFMGGNGENRFSVLTDGPDFISSVLIQTSAGDFITDVRQVRLGLTPGSGEIASVQEQQLLASPEPGTLLMLATGLFGLAHAARRRLIR